MLKGLTKMKKKSQKPYLTNYNLLTAQIYGKLIIKSCWYLAEEIHKIKCKYGHNNEKCDTCSNKGCLH